MRLLRGPGSNHLGRVDDLQRVGVVSALEIERLVVGAVDMNQLASVQANPNASRRAATLIGPVPHDDVPAALRALARAQETTGALQVEEIADLGKVSLVGAGMRSHPGVAARMFRTLADEDVNLRLISTSPIKVSCLIPRSDVERAVRALHAAFSLGADAEANSTK